ncbi:hypothetical protein VTH82DRAFT_8583 [Thermothelomyces myriococcoides]
MTASQRLLPETMRAEADYAEIQHKIDELGRHYGIQEKQALAELEERLTAVNAEFEKEKAKMKAELHPSQELLGSVLMALSKKRDLETAEIRRTYQQKADERKKLYEERRQEYDLELYRAITAIMMAGKLQSSAHSSPRSGSALKRKANEESNLRSPADSPGVKRAKLEGVNGADISEVDHPLLAASDAAFGRSVSFEEVYGSPEKPAPYKHIIVQYPPTVGYFYILKCDEHGVHFGEHPLRGAAKHLASAQHGYMSKAHATAIETLGYRVRGCTREMADKNNREVLRAFKDGSYKAFNANNLSQTKRAELGYPPVDPLVSQKPVQHRKQTAAITEPQPCRFYVTSGGDLRYPVLILPWGDISEAGLVGTLADTGIFREFTDDGRPLGVPKLPKCYVYREVDDHIVGIKGWAKGYESGGPLERKREFPVLCAENADYRMWSVGWVKASHLSPLDFDNPSSRDIPFVREAWHYFQTRILRRQADVYPALGTRLPPGSERERNETPPQSTQRSSREHAPGARGEDVEMKDASRVVESGDASKEGANNTGAPGGEDNQSIVISKSASSPKPSVQHIAAQALNLQGPKSSGFTVINAGGDVDRSACRSACINPESQPGSGSVSSTGSGGHRRVFKIHARSSNRPSSTGPTQSSLSRTLLPEGPADGTIPPSSAANQTQGAVRKLSPASLQNILQDFPAPAAANPRVDSQSPKPAGTRCPLPSEPIRMDSPSQLASKPSQLVTSNDRAGSAPAQLPPQTGDLVAEEMRLSGTASAALSLGRRGTPQPAAAPTGTPSPIPATAPEPSPEPDQRWERKSPPIRLPPPATTLPPISHLNTGPPSVVNSSVASTRTNSPTLSHATENGTPTTAGFSEPANSAFVPSLPLPQKCFVPTMDVFDLTCFRDGDKELFRSTEPGQYLRLIDDHQSGVFTTASDSAVKLRIDPQQIKSAERVSAQAGAVCVVTLVYHSAQDAREGNQSGEAGSARTQTLIFEKARSTARGLENGSLHARRLCRRLQVWNPAIVCPTPTPT